MPFLFARIVVLRVMATYAQLTLNKKLIIIVTSVARKEAIYEPVLNPNALPSSSSSEVIICISLYLSVMSFILSPRKD